VQRGLEVAGGQAPQVQNRQHLGDVGGPTHVRRQDGAGELVLLPLLVCALVVDPRRLNLRWLRALFRVQQQNLRLLGEDGLSRLRVVDAIKLPCRRAPDGGLELNAQGHGVAGAAELREQLERYEVFRIILSWPQRTERQPAASGQRLSAKVERLGGIGAQRLDEAPRDPEVLSALRQADHLGHDAGVCAGLATGPEPNDGAWLQPQEAGGLAAQVDAGHHLLRRSNFEAGLEHAHFWPVSPSPVEGNHIPRPCSGAFMDRECS